MDVRACLNCGTLISHRRDQHITMVFSPRVAESPDYIVAINGVEVHRCSGPTRFDPWAEPVSQAD